jgi:hypothetical protein
VTHISTFIRRALPGDSWRPWRSVIAAALGKPPGDPALVRRIADRKHLPTRPVKEGWIIAGRGSGKSRAVATVGAAFATCRTYRRAPGERIYVGIFAPDRKQSAITLAYVRGLLHSSAALERMIVEEFKEAIELAEGVVIEVITASAAAPRGRSYAVVIAEEAAFFPTDTSADPDLELFRAVRPALARVPGSLLLVVSSAYARRGELYRAWEHRHERQDDTLIVQADTLTLNPSFDAGEIERAMRDDPASALAEYHAQFRADIQVPLRGRPWPPSRFAAGSSCRRSAATPMPRSLTRAAAASTPSRYA